MTMMEDFCLLFAVCCYRVPVCSINLSIVKCLNIFNFSFIIFFLIFSFFFLFYSLVSKSFNTKMIRFLVDAWGDFLLCVFVLHSVGWDG